MCQIYRQACGVNLAVAAAFVGVMSGGALAQGSASVRAVVRSVSDASIGSDAGARIIAIPFREGASFHQNDVLVAFECSKTRAELKSAQAEWHGHQLAWQNNVNLQKYHAAGNNDVQISKTQMEKAAAVVEGWTAKVEQCEIKAPFDGSVADVFIHVFELPNPSNPIIRIVDLEHLEADMIVPSSAAARIKVGDAFAFRIDETGETVQGHVVRIAAAIDPVSQTMKVIGALDKDGHAIMPGMSGKADFGAIF